MLHNVTVGKYRFTIKETTMQYESNIINSTFTIGGDYQDCVTVSIRYSNGIPVDAKLPYVRYEPECSVGSNLEKGIGSIAMIRTVIRFAYEKTGVTTYGFDDMSHIDCGSEEQLKWKSSPPRKEAKPLKLSYFYILYHGKTWYEQNFHATMKDAIRYETYRDRVLCLINPEQKPSYPEFLAIARVPEVHHARLAPYYETSSTYREFVKKIPIKERCEILSPWLVSFMSHYLQGVFTDNDWVIDMDRPVQRGKRRTRKSRHRFIHFQETHALF